MSTEASAPPPGWYPDPVAREELRFFDGTVWTQETRTRTPNGTGPGGPHSELVPDARTGNNQAAFLAIALAAFAAVGLVIVLALQHGSDQTDTAVSTPFVVPEPSVVAGSSATTVWTPALEASAKRYLTDAGASAATADCALSVIPKDHPNPAEFGAMSVRAQTNAQDMGTLQALATKIDAAC